jgi:glutaminase
VGDADHGFAIESISKTFTLSLALRELGPAELLRKIGSEPTGLPFNSVLAIEQEPGRTVNPFVNAGAIATTSLLPGKAGPKWDNLLAFYSKMAGQPLKLMEDVYRSETATNMHNQAITRLIASYNRLYSDPAEALDVYTRQCSVSVSAKELAMMGAVLANGGVNPVTREALVPPALLPRILAVMTMAGLYNHSGTWAWEVGLPAKSGVGGGIVAVVPGRAAIAVFSPPLDEYGNSVRGQRAIELIAQKLHLNVYQPPCIGRSLSPAQVSQGAGDTR